MQCNLCPRQCNADRSVKSGYCGADNTVYIARAAAHMWEEPCISGKNGSGAVFFSGCPLHCIYCQNKKISDGKAGHPITVEELASVFGNLQNQGLHNINLVTPTHYTTQIAKALKISCLKIPVVYNCGGYEKPETLSLLDGLVDIYMPDFKYFYKKTASDFSNAPDYPVVALRAVQTMYSQTKKPVFENGLMKKGVLVRHLVLPEHTLESKKILSLLYENFGNDIYISIMNQYTPMRQFDAFPELNRTVSAMEYRDVVRYAERLGIVNAFVQEGDTAKESFIPDFEG